MAQKQNNQAKKTEENQTNQAKKTETEENKSNQDLQLQKFKQKYGQIYTLEIQGDEKTYKAYFRKPERQEYFAFFNESMDDPLKGFETLFNTCWLDGDQEILDDDELYISAIQQMSSLVNIYKTYIKKN